VTTPYHLCQEMTGPKGQRTALTAASALRLTQGTRPRPHADLPLAGPPGYHTGPDFAVEANAIFLAVELTHLAP
jgi:hypothetical protein